MELIFRSEQEMKDAVCAFFLTLTYDNEHCPSYEGINVLRKRDLQLFFKRLRRYGVLFRYFAIGEYGPTTHRPHYHILLFLKELYDLHKFSKLVEALWSFGFVSCSDVNGARIAYTVGYMCPVNELSSFFKQFPPFTLRSLGYGGSYLTEERKDYYTNLLYSDSENDRHPYAYIQGKFRITLPRYYKDRIYGISEKEAIKCKVADDFRRETEEDIEESERFYEYLNTLSDERGSKEFFDSLRTLDCDRANRLVNSEKEKQKLIKKRKI